MNEYIYFIEWKEKSNFNPKRTIEFGKLLRVYADDIDQAQTKIHNWVKNSSKYKKATIEYFEGINDIEVIKG